MIIELSGVQFGLKSYAWFQNRTTAQREFDLTKIARPEVQYHFIRSILKSHNFMALNLRF